MPDKIIDGDDGAAAIVQPEEDDGGPASHADRLEAESAEAERLAGDGADEHALVTGAGELLGGEQLIPRAQPADVFVLRRTVRQLEQGRAAAADHGADQAERERVGQPADRAPEILHGAAGDLAEAQHTMAPRRPHGVVDVARKRIERITAEAREPALARRVRHGTK